MKFLSSKEFQKTVGSGKKLQKFYKKSKPRKIFRKNFPKVLSLKKIFKKNIFLSKFGNWEKM